MINLKITEKNGPVVAIRQVYEMDEYLMITSGGQLMRGRVKDISVIGRATQGVRLINLKGDDRLVSIAKIEEKDTLASANGTNGAGAPGPEGSADGGSPDPGGVDGKDGEPG